MRITSDGYHDNLITTTIRNNIGIHFYLVKHSTDFLSASNCTMNYLSLSVHYTLAVSPSAYLSVSLSICLCCNRPARYFLIFEKTSAIVFTKSVCIKFYNSYVKIPLKIFCIIKELNSI